MNHYAKEAKRLSEELNIEHIIKSRKFIYSEEPRISIFRIGGVDGHKRIRE